MPIAQPGQSSPRLELDSVSVEIGGVMVLRAVSLQLPPARRVALIGRNGAGKMTMLRTLMELVKVRHGCLLIAGKDETVLPAHHRSRYGIGYAPEDRRLFGLFTVEQNLLLPVQVLGLTAEEDGAGSSASMICCLLSGCPRPGGQRGCSAGRAKG